MSAIPASTGGETRFTSRRLDLGLPRLPVLTTYVDRSYTKVKLAPGFHCSMRFEPWTEFEEKVKDTKAKVEQIPDAARKEVESLLCHLRNKIAPTQDAEDSVEQERGLRLCSLSDEPDSDHEGRRELNCVMRTGGRTESRNNGRAIRSVDNPGDANEHAYSEVGYTSCLSEIGAAVEDESISLEMAEQMGITAFSNTNSCTSVNHIVFDVVEILIRAIRKQRSLFLLPQLQLPSELGKKYERLLTPKEFCTLVPDFALARTSDRPCKQLPICSYELKGPLRTFWKVSERPKTAGRPQKKQRINQDDVEASGPIEAKVEVEVVRGGRVATTGRRESPEAYSAQGLAAFYNDMFRDSSLMQRTSSNDYLFLFLPVAQALSQALLSDSGCCVLYNHQEAIAFDVYIPKKGGGNTKAGNDEKDGSKIEEEGIRVRVSRAFSCDEEPGNICALVALANYSCDVLNTEKDRKLNVRELFSKVTHAYVDWKLGGNRVRNFTPGATGAHGEHTNAGTGSTGTARQSAHSSRSIGADNIYCELLDTSSSESCGDEMTVNSEDAFTRVLADIVATNEGVIGTGSSAVALGAYYKVLHVAIKSWNGLSHEGIDCLLNEVEVYKLLMERSAKVLGVGVPCLRM